MIFAKKYLYVVNFVTKVSVCCDFYDKSICILGFYRQKSAYFVIFVDKKVFCKFLLQISVLTKFWVQKCLRTCSDDGDNEDEDKS